MNGVTGENLAAIIARSRLDNVVFRRRLRPHPQEARQSVRRGHFTVSSKRGHPVLPRQAGDVVAVEKFRDLLPSGGLISSER